MIDPVLAVLVAARLAVFGLGAAVAVRGIRGYRRTGSRPLLAFGVAFALVSVDPLVQPVVAALAGARAAGYAAVGADVVLFGGAFSLVLYALYRLA